MKISNERIGLSFVLVMSWAVLCSAGPGDYAIVHHFAGLTNDGARPVAALIEKGGMLYGMTPYGGRANLGCVFRLNPESNQYALMHVFQGGDGACPLGALSPFGTNLFGMTSRGGTNNDGVIFRIGLTGEAFAVVHHFDANNANNGAMPWGTLVEYGGLLFGMTYNGGESNRGVLFRINADGTGYTNLHKFRGPPNDGKHPKGDLLVSGTRLYGLASEGGSNNMGVVFSMALDGTDYRVLYHFKTHDTGVNPAGSLVQAGNYLYGITPSGSNNGGAIFRLSTDGREFAWLRPFTNSVTEGVSIYSSLVEHDGGLYGVARFGGTNGGGVLFSLGGAFSNQYSWDSPAEPLGSLLFVDDQIFGTTFKGGVFGLGTLFKFTPYPEVVTSAWCAITWIDGGGMGETVAGDANTKRMYVRHSKDSGPPDHAYIGYGRTLDVDDETWIWIPMHEVGELADSWEYTGRLGRASSGDYFVAAKFIKGSHVYYPPAQFGSWSNWNAELYATNRWRVLPLMPPSNVCARYVTSNRIDVTFNGDGTHWVIAFRKSASTGEFENVVDGQEYYTGQDYGSKGVCVYRGSGLVVTNNNLNPNSTYQFRLYTENYSFYSTGVWVSASTSPNADDDGDRMPNQYEVDKGFNPGSSVDGFVDTDGDGMLNWKEYVAGTDPLNKASYFAIVTGEYDKREDSIVLGWTSVTGKRYAVDMTDNLRAGLTNTIVSQMAATPPVNTWTGAMTGVERLYLRVRVEE